MCSITDISQYMNNVQRNLPVCMSSAAVQIGSSIMKAERFVAEQTMALIRTIQEIALNIIHGIAEGTKNIDIIQATLKLFEAGMSLAKMNGIEPETFEPVASVFKNITNFVNGRSIFSRIDGLVSGKEATADVPKGEINYLRVGSRMALGVADTINTAKWLSEMELCGRGDWFDEPVGTTSITPKNIQSMCAITGFALNIVNLTKRALQEGVIPGVKTILSLASDISKLVATVLFSMGHNKPLQAGGFVFQSIGNITFLIKQYIPDDCPPAPAGAHVPGRT